MEKKYEIIVDLENVRQTLYEEIRFLYNSGYEFEEDTDYEWFEEIVANFSVDYQIIEWNCDETSNDFYKWKEIYLVYIEKSKRINDIIISMKKTMKRQKLMEYKVGK